MVTRIDRNTMQQNLDFDEAGPKMPKRKRQRSFMTGIPCNMDLSFAFICINSEGVLVPTVQTKGQDRTM